MLSKFTLTFTFTRVHPAGTIPRAPRFGSSGELPCCSSKDRVNRIMEFQNATNDLLNVDLRSVPKLGSTDLPSVYVYELPHELSGGEVLRWPSGIPFGSPGCTDLPRGDPEKHDCLFRTQIPVLAPTTGQLLSLSPTATMGASQIVHARLLASARRVYSPSQADLFYVPIYREEITNTVERLARCPNASQVVSLLPYLNEATAGRHLMVIGRTGIVGHTSRLESRGFDACPALHNTVLPWKTAEQKRPDGSLTAEGLITKMLRVATEDTFCCMGNWGHWATWSTPCGNVGSGLSSSQLSSLRRAADPAHARSQLVMATLGLHGKHVALRTAWKADCKAHPRCDYVELTSGQPETATWPRLLSSMLNSTFCLQPMGDSPTRKSIIDSILLGCIPVLSDVGQTRAWTWHLGQGWSRFAILHKANTGLMQKLESVHPDMILRLRKGLASVSQRLPYRTEDGHGDAVEMMLAGVLRVVRYRQQTAQSHLTAAEEYIGREVWRIRREVAATPHKMASQKPNATNDLLNVDLRSVPKLGSTDLPSVYVYELPHELSGGEVLRWPSGIPFGSPGCTDLPRGDPEKHDCLFRTQIPVLAPTTGQLLSLSPTATMGASQIVHARLLASARRVYSPSQADLFYVPIYREEITNTVERLARCPNASQVVSLLPYLNEATAGRHLMVIGRTGIVGHTSRLESRGFDACPALHNTVLPWKTAEQKRPDGSLTAEGLITKMLRVATEDTFCCMGNWGHWATWSTPCGNVGSGLSSSQLSSLRRAADPAHARSQLVMATLGLHGKHVALRTAWKADCKAHPRCDYVELTSGQPETATWPRLLSSMLNSTFCLQPMGDSPTRKSIIDSILLGCIPVLSDVGQTRAWTWHLGQGWSRFAILHKANTGLMQKLESVHPDMILRLRKGLASVSQRLPYRTEDGHGDAVEMMLAGVLRVVRYRQQTAQSHLTAAEEYIGREVWRIQREAAAWARKHSRGGHHHG